MKNTYRTANESNQDKAQLAELLAALNAPPSALRRNGEGLWILRGDPGCYASTWGDGKGWQLVVMQEISARQWAFHKKRLAFAELTQDGEQEGCFRLHRLPTEAEAETIRDILGIRKDYSPEELDRRREMGRRFEGNLRRHETRFQPPASAQMRGPVASSVQPAAAGGQTQEPKDV